MNKTYLSKPDVARRYGRTVRTIDNWMERPEMNFARPIVVNGRQLFPIEGDGGLDAWDLRMAAPKVSGSEVQRAA